MTAPKDRLVILIPAHNEAETLRPVLTAIKAACERIKDRHKLIIKIAVADDGSTDGTPDIAREFTPYVYVSNDNQGVGAITRLGLMYIVNKNLRPDWLIKIDADFQYMPGLIPHMMERLKAGSDIVNCSRFHPDVPRTDEVPGHKRRLNIIFNALLADVTGWPVTDARSGLIGYRGEIVCSFAEKIITRTYGIPIELFLRSWFAKRDLVYTELPHSPRYWSEEINPNRITRVEGEKYDPQAQMDRLLMVMDNFERMLADLGLENYHASPERVGNQFFELRAGLPVLRTPEEASPKDRTLALLANLEPVSEPPADPNTHSLFEKILSGLRWGVLGGR